MIQIIESLEEFENLREKWGCIQPIARAFQTFDWCWHGWKSCQSFTKSHLWILVWQSDGMQEDTVIFPWYIDARGTLRFIMDDFTDTCDAVYSSNRLNRSLCYKEVADEILKNDKIRSCHFRKLAGDSEVLHYLGVYLLWPFVYRDVAVSYLELPQSDDVVSSFVHMRTKDRSRLRGFLQKANEYNYHVYQKSNGEPFPEEKIRMLRDEMIARGIRKPDFFPESFMVFTRGIYDAGLCEIVTLEDAQGVAALSFRLKQGFRIHSWILLYREANMTTLLHTRFFAESALRGAYCHDLGVGVYAYKMGNFRPSVEINFTLGYGKEFCGLLQAFLRMSLRIIKDSIHRMKGLL